MLPEKGEKSMDSGKTGALIAEARKAKGLTQRQLAETLHISDRPVSNGARGAGFPDPPCWSLWRTPWASR